MPYRALATHVAVLAIAHWAASAVAQTGPLADDRGHIAADLGGAPGYKHSLERSRFVIGASPSTAPRRIEENGFSKIVGENGVAATDQRTGLFVATESASVDKARIASPGSVVQDPDRHNEAVIEYFRSAGIPADQIGGVHATTYLSSSGSLADARPAPPKIDGYASVLERKIEGVAVSDSSAWARLNERGEVVSEWIYWPAIPGSVVAGAKRLREMISGTSRSDYLARLPADLPAGIVVIRHSSATSPGQFEAFASYDIIERKSPAGVPYNASANMSLAYPAISTTRHFDEEGRERRLPQEQRNLGATYPENQKTPLQEQRGR